MKQKLKIIKIGGNVINDNSALNSFLSDFSKIKGLKILVHGGGKKATEMSKALGLKSEMIGGRRITDKANLEIVTMVYAGLLNKKIIAQLQQNNCNAIGLSGADANTILAHKRVVKGVDYGFAGDIDWVNDKMIKLFLDGDLIPVFCAITHDKKGQLLNTNSVIETLNTVFYQDLKQEGIIADGMLPKLDNCFNALINGVSKVIIGKPQVIVNMDLKHTAIVL